LAIPGCAREGETLEELLENVHEAVEGCLSIDVRGLTLKQSGRVLEIAV
jgi:predicted RNase H-like HicB family nuclease